MKTKPKELRMQQIIALPWDGDRGRTCSVLALSTEGKVYRYDPICDDWIPWGMQAAPPPSKSEK